MNWARQIVRSIAEIGLERWSWIVGIVAGIVAIVAACYGFVLWLRSGASQSDASTENPSRSHMSQVDKTNNVFVPGFVKLPVINVPDEFRLNGTNSEGLLEYLHIPTGIIMVLIEKGQFRLGLDSGEREGVYASLKQEFSDMNFDLAIGDLNCEQDARTVTLRSFLVGKYEVSRAEWAATMGGQSDSRSGDMNLPISNITWTDSINFCTRAGLSLPTEDQWEAACRMNVWHSPMGQKSEQVIVNSIKYGPDVGAVRCDSMTPNPAGLYHILGNVREWCGGEFECPAVLPGKRKPVRGGSFFKHRVECRPTARAGLDPGSKYPDVGFRVVANL